VSRGGAEVQTRSRLRAGELVVGVAAGILVALLTSLIPVIAIAIVGVLVIAVWIGLANYIDALNLWRSVVEDKTVRCYRAVSAGINDDEGPASTPFKRPV
jgi:hypothetical protein